jgi:hypothetical protein
VDCGNTPYLDVNDVASLKVTPVAVNTAILSQDFFVIYLFIVI